MDPSIREHGPSQQNEAGVIGTDAASNAEIGTRESNSQNSLRHHLPPIEREPESIPTFVFKKSVLADDKPTEHSRVLEVSMLWQASLQAIEHFKEPQRVTIGESKYNDFVVADDVLSEHRFSFITAEDDAFWVNWVSGMTMEVRDGDGQILGEDELLSLGRLRRVQGPLGMHSKYRIDLNDRVAVQVGAVTFVVQFVASAPIVAVPWTQAIDFYFPKVLSLVLLAHLCFVTALAFAPDLSKEKVDIFERPDRFTSVVLQPPSRPKIAAVAKALPGSKKGGQADKAEGKFGAPDKLPQKATASLRGAQVVRPSAQERNRRIVESNALIAMLNQSPDRAEASDRLGPGGLGVGLNAALGGLSRSGTQANATGARGAGRRGYNPGGGGKSALGIGGFGRDGSKGLGGIGGIGDIELGGRAQRATVVTPPPKRVGCLSSSQVSKVLRRIQGRARACYERELAKSPALQGKITTSFEINASGAVNWVRVVEDTIGSEMMKQCLSRIIQTQRFDPCKGGGDARVTYPWAFKQSG